jgi:UDP-glucose 4-epimerase
VLIWIVGQSGLLGSALARTSRSDSSFTLFTTEPISWGETELACIKLSSLSKQFALEADGDLWAIIWAAGHATVASSEEDTLSELHTLQSLCESVKRNPPRGRGAFFLSSSAGGVYAGSTNPPFSLETEPVPLSAYGRLKLAQEHTVRSELSGVCPVVIGRISNLYGPGQDLAKLQGLISALARAAVTRKPINIFVSLDTIRDYLYVNDAADQILRLVSDAAASASTGTDGTHILASGKPVSLGYLINLVQDIARVKVPVALGAHASAVAQSRDLRLVPSPMSAGTEFQTTPLSAGVKNVFLDVLQRAQEAR